MPDSEILAANKRLSISLTVPLKEYPSLTLLAMSSDSAPIARPPFSGHRRESKAIDTQLCVLHPAKLRSKSKDDQQYRHNFARPMEDV